MIDFIKSIIPKFDGNLNACHLHCTYAESISYRLYKTVEKKGAFLSLNLKTKTKTLRISGSFRKWYFGSSSLANFDANSFHKALQHLSKMLSLPYSIICKSMVSQCEMGLNVIIRIPCEKIIPKIIQYGHLKRYEYAEETVGFNGSNKKLKIYHKCNEILAKQSNKLSASTKRVFAILQEKGNYFLRIEFTLFDKQSFVQHDLGYINTLGDIDLHYNALFDFWTKQVNKIVMSNIIIFDEAMTPREYQIGLCIATNGFNDFVHECLKRCKSKTDAGLRTARSKAYKEILEVSNKYSSNQEYNKNSLRVDIAKNLIRISSNDKTLHLPVLIKNLWGA